jgi:hypothetical protein
MLITPPCRLVKSKNWVTHCSYFSCSINPESEIPTAEKEHRSQ